MTPQGLTRLGFEHLLRCFCVAKKWRRCWDVLRFYHHQNDLTLHPRVLASLPNTAHTHALELTHSAFLLLERLFVVFTADTT